MNSPTLITRSEARKQLQYHLDIGGHCACCEQRETLKCFDMWRNYEIEAELEKAFGGTYVVKELCPFHGETCRWGVLEKKRREESKE